jgi:hypothetical protein
LKDRFYSPKDSARLAALELRCTDRNRRAAARREAEEALLVADHPVVIASVFRQLQDFDGAGRLAEKVLALGKRVVGDHRDEPYSHLAPSFAYGQVYRYAYDAHDEGKIESNMRLAPDAAEQALLRNPANERARH